MICNWLGTAMSATALIAVIATASPASGRSGDFEGTRVHASPFGRGGVTLDAGDANNAIAVRTDDVKNEIVITDKSGVKIDPRYPQYASLCNQVSANRVRCSLYEPGGIRAVLGEGDDSIEVDSTRRAPVVVTGYGGNDSIFISTPTDATSSRLQGNGGSDLIVGGASGDRLRGGAGHDVVKGLAGDDLLAGKGGADVLRGGAGNDRLKATHDDADRSLRCGPGEDSAKVDRKLDPKPLQCERINLK